MDNETLQHIALLALALSIIAIIISLTAFNLSVENTQSQS